MSELIYALILGVVEGITEFLPISSTGHLILASALLGATDERWTVFNLVIQTGAMLAVVWEYRARFFRVDRRLYLNLIVAFIPAAVLGLLFGKLIKAHLFHAVPVAIAFIVGALVIFWVERDKQRHVRIDSTDQMSWLDALKVGCAQCFQNSNLAPPLQNGHHQRVNDAQRGHRQCQAAENRQQQIENREK